MTVEQETDSFSRKRHVVFTINNYTDEDISLMETLPTSYLVYGKEVGENGTPHLQCYAELTKQMRFGAIKKCLPRAWIAKKREGTAAQAADYCKKDGEYKEIGTISRPGTRTDIAAYVKDIREGKKTELEIIDAHPSAYCKYYKAYDRIKLVMARADKTPHEVQVFVRYGRAGTGKTRFVYENEPDVYQVPTGAKWFDGYDGQEAILFDDFDNAEIDYLYFLRLTDRYRFIIPIKGGFTWKSWKRVYITSNRHPRYWYPEGMTEALERRFTRVDEVGAVVLPPTSETELVRQSHSI